MAAERLQLARAHLTTLAEELTLPIENLLTPDHVRRVLWKPPSERDQVALAQSVAEALRQLGAREWQIDYAAPVLAKAILAAEPAD